MASCNPRLFILFCISFILFIFGLLLLGIGGIIQIVNIDESYVSNLIMKASSILISIGSSILITGILGCWAAFTEKYCILISYGVFMIGMFIVGLIGAIMGYVTVKETGSSLGDALRSSMHEYDKTVKYKDYWDFFQIELQCCGFNGPADWETILSKTIPVSCCKIVASEDFFITFECTEKNAYKDGCYPFVMELFNKQAIWIRDAAAILLSILFVIIIFIFYYARTVHKNIYTRKSLSYNELQVIGDSTTEQSVN